MRAAGGGGGGGLGGRKNGAKGKGPPPLSPPLGLGGGGGGGGLIKRTTISNTPQFNTVSWPHKEGYVVNGLNTGAWACVYYIQQFHLSYVRIFFAVTSVPVLSIFP